MHRRNFIALTLPACLPAAASLNGRWRSVTTSRGGIGAVYFQPNGAARYSSAAIVAIGYQPDGNQIILGGQPVGVGWHPDGRLQFNFGGNQVEDYVRQGKLVDPERPLLGEWKGLRTMQGRQLPVTLQFHANGQALMVIFLKTLAGRYTTAPGGEWTLALPSLPPRTITEASGQLTITAAGGDPHQFARF
jgi:hypothetical protein